MEPSEIDVSIAYEADGKTKDALIRVSRDTRASQVALASWYVLGAGPNQTPPMGSPFLALEQTAKTTTVIDPDLRVGDIARNGMLTASLVVLR
jgi:hypothetical protein